MSISVDASLVITSLRIAAIDLRLANHCRRIFVEQPGRVGLVETDRAGRPAIGKGQPVQVVEEAGPGLRREAHDGERAQMCAAEPRLEAAGQRPRRPGCASRYIGVSGTRTRWRRVETQECR